MLKQQKAVLVLGRVPLIFMYLSWYVVLISNDLWSHRVRVMVIGLWLYGYGDRVMVIGLG